MGWLLGVEPGDDGTVRRHILNRGWQDGCKRQSNFAAHGQFGFSDRSLITGTVAIVSRYRFFRWTFPVLMAGRL